MIRSVLSWACRRKLRKLAFPEQQGRTASDTTSEIIAAFEQAVLVTLREETPEAIRSMALQTPWNRRPFFWEGHAFAVSALHSCLFRRGNPNTKYASNSFRAMFYTGTGFWRGFARSNFLPRCSLRTSQWAAVDDFQPFLPMLAGGEGFAVTAEAGCFEQRIWQLFQTGNRIHPHWSEGAVLGSGRALWFLYMHNYERILEALADNAHEALVIGTGLAMTYTQIATPERILKGLDALTRHGELLLVGVCIALAGLSRDDPEATERIEQLPDPFASWYGVGLRAFDESLCDRNWCRASAMHIQELLRDAQCTHSGRL